MQYPPIERKIKYEAELDPGFAEEISSVPGGESLRRCMQCGTCSATCPLSIYMDYTPRRVLAMTRAGFKKEVLNCFTIWLCASCYSCSVECPKQIKITDVMYALKRMAIKERTYPKHFPTPVLAKAFFESVQKHGRSNEARVVTQLYLKTNPFHLLTQSTMGFRLWRRGRFGLKTESICNKRQLRTLLQSVEESDRPKPKGVAVEGGHR
ncbi:MAG TPA: 4Fe-4S dicluster domain-containing protein [Candidatus Deferrimicrobium sp.]|nr:4Fe-4S dicluster domain-containing protein [Candidatus Deferrimicrobium sp.]